MNSQLTIFDFNGREVRTASIDGTPWWVAKDVCDVLEIANHSDAIGRLDDDEKGVAIADTPGGKQGLAVINESGLYSLILRSRKPEAKAFKKWVTSEVLPALRKHGGYSTRSSSAVPEVIEQALLTLIQNQNAIMDNHQTMANSVSTLAERVARLEQGKSFAGRTFDEEAEEAGAYKPAIKGGPILDIRRKLGLSRVDFAARVDMSVKAVKNAERGTVKKLTKWWEPGLTRLGYNYEAIASLYKDWRESYFSGQKVVSFPQKEGGFQ